MSGDYDWDTSPLFTGPDDGAAILDDLHAVLRRYVVMPSASHEHAVVLWIAATHCVASFEFAPRLVIHSAMKRSGKSRLLQIIEHTCSDPLATVNATTAAVFRSLGSDPPPTLLIDEADAIFGTRIKAEQNDDLRALLNAGFERGKPALRTVGPTHTPTKFATFAMAALCGIGKMPDTIEDRAVVVPMQRRMPSESVDAFRSRRDGEPLTRLRERLRAWAGFVVEAMKDAHPLLPVDDRAGDLFEPLVIVADAAGGHWPGRARKAAQVLTAQRDSEDADDSLDTRLLGDIRGLFAWKITGDAASSVLILALRQIEDAPWLELDLTVRKLARRLKPLGVAPTQNPAKTFRGYRVADFTDAFARYLPTHPSGSSNRPEPNKSGTSRRTDDRTDEESEPSGEVSGTDEESEPSGDPSVYSQAIPAVTDGWTDGTARWTGVGLPPIPQSPPPHRHARAVELAAQVGAYYDSISPEHRLAVLLDWSPGRHWRERPGECWHCHSPELINLVDDQCRYSHKVCAEIADYLAGPPVEDDNTKETP